MLINSKLRDKEKFGNIKTENSEICITSTVKYLEIHLDKELNLKYHITPASWSSGNEFVFEAGVRGLNLGLVKSDKLLPTARHHCNSSLKEAVFPGCNEMKVGPANSLHTSV